MTARGGRWLVAGGLLGLALAPPARRAALSVRARAERLARRGPDDPVAAFRAAPCYAYDRAAAGDAAAAEARR